jgi:hypothetical protein
MSAEAGPSNPSSLAAGEQPKQVETSYDTTRKYGRGGNPKLRYKKPYWWAYKTFVKQR